MHLQYILYSLISMHNLHISHRQTKFIWKMHMQYILHSLISIFCTYCNVALRLHIFSFANLVLHILPILYWYFSVNLHHFFNLVDILMLISASWCDDYDEQGMRTVKMIMMLLLIMIDNGVNCDSNHDDGDDDDDVMMVMVMMVMVMIVIFSRAS